MILLDTHALLWWALDPAKLSEKAAETCARMERDGGFASAISLWELGVKVRNGKLDLGMSLEEFARRLESSGVIELIAVDASLWVRTANLAWAHRDPADRVIAATALQRDLPILTRDESFHSCPGVRSLW